MVYLWWNLVLCPSPTVLSQQSVSILHYTVKFYVPVLLYYISAICVHSTLYCQSLLGGTYMYYYGHLFHFQPADPPGCLTLNPYYDSLQFLAQLPKWDQGKIVNLIRLLRTYFILTHCYQSSTLAAIMLFSHLISKPLLAIIELSGICGTSKLLTY